LPYPMRSDCPHLAKARPESRITIVRSER
jgi:hypothetical protein